MRQLTLSELVASAAPASPAGCPTESLPGQIHKDFGEARESSDLDPEAEEHPNQIYGNISGIFLALCAPAFKSVLNRSRGVLVPGLSRAHIKTPLLQRSSWTLPSQQSIADRFSSGARAALEQDARIQAGHCSLTGHPEGDSEEHTAEGESSNDASNPEDLEFTTTAGIPSSVNLGATECSILVQLDDPYGSPSLEDIEAFQHALLQKLEEIMGSDKAGHLQLEVSTPGAERLVRFPQDLRRFAGLPMKVEFLQGDEVSAKRKLRAAILQFKGIDDEAASTSWQWANVRANRPNAKGSKLTKKREQEELNIPVAAMQQVKLYLDL
ncbi:hypothetical protein MMC29_005233 [Sticta canariensis]|nr:hypothetical protein [Sticta canariensis]